MKKMTESNPANQKPADQKPAEKLKLPMKPLIAIAAVLIIVIIGLVIEAVNSNRYSIKNNTGTDIESIVVYFENDSENDSYIGENLFELSIPAGEKKTGTFKKQDSPYLYGSSLMIKVNFAGREPVYLYSGYFTNVCVFNKKNTSKM